MGSPVEEDAQNAPSDDPPPESKWSISPRGAIAIAIVIVIAIAAVVVIFTGNGRRGTDDEPGQHFPQPGAAARCSQQNSTTLVIVESSHNISQTCRDTTPAAGTYVYNTTEPVLPVTVQMNNSAAKSVCQLTGLTACAGLTCWQVMVIASTDHAYMATVHPVPNAVTFAYLSITELVQVSLSVHGNGTVNTQPVIPKSTRQWFPVGLTIEIIASPDAGWGIHEFRTSPAVGTTPILTNGHSQRRILRVPATNVHVVVSFRPQFYVNVTHTDGGTVTFITSNSIGTAGSLLTEGTNVTLHAQAAANFGFVEWEITYLPSGTVYLLSDNPITVSITSNVRIHGVFRPVKVVQLRIVGDGTITNHHSTTILVPVQSCVTIEVRPGADSKFVMAVGVSDTAPFDICIDDKDRSVVVVFGWTYMFPGIAYGPYTSGAPGYIVSNATITRHLEVLRPYTHAIRIYSCGAASDIVRVAKELGLLVEVGGWVSRDATATSAEMDCLVDIAAQVDAVVVGNEAVLRKDVSPTQLLVLYDYVKTRVPATTTVAIADTFRVFLEHPSLLSHPDKVLVHIHPFWERIRPVWAAAAAETWLNVVREHPSSNGTDVEVGEIGWPTAGQAHGDAVPSVANMVNFFLELAARFTRHSTRFFAFEGFDEPWKSNEPYGVGPHWGFFTTAFAPKPGFNTIAQGRSFPTLSGRFFVDCHPPCDGKPHVWFVDVPPIGSSAPVSGATCNLNPFRYSIVLYINAPWPSADSWWIKPAFDYPHTAIQGDGKWSNVYANAGVDNRAPRIRAYLVPLGAPIAILGGQTTFPSFMNDYVFAEVTR